MTSLTMGSLGYLGKTVHITVDRPLGSRHPTHDLVYELNYGYVPGTQSGDGEELDAYVLGVSTPVATFTGHCIAVIRRTSEDDDKLIVAPPGFRCTEAEIRRATHFQERYFQSVIHLDASAGRAV